MTKLVRIEIANIIKIAISMEIMFTTPNVFTITITITITNMATVMITNMFTITIIITTITIFKSPNLSHLFQGSLVVQVQAVDGDAGVGNAVTYKIISGKWPLLVGAGGGGVGM